MRRWDEGRKTSGSIAYAFGPMIAVVGLMAGLALIVGLVMFE